MITGIAGEKVEDRKLWHTYFYWAREKVLTLSTSDPDESAIIDNPKNRIGVTPSNILQAILFSAFALEYRLKRTLEFMSVKVPKKVTLGPLLDIFWRELSKVDKYEDNVKCSPPGEWKSIKADLTKLVELRNRIAHANYKKTSQIFADESEGIKQALRCYNAVVDAVKLINFGTGYDKRPLNELEEYFKPLKVK
jgi:hypothetical protein